MNIYCVTKVQISDFRVQTSVQTSDLTGMLNSELLTLKFH